MTPAKRFPDFVIIGAVKGATTWLHAQLQANPNVFLPDPEPHYFSREYQRGPAFYARFFIEAASHQCVGEKSADYLAHPAAALRLARMLPGAKLVAQLRNPVDRAYSDYKMLYRRGTVRGGPEAYLARRGGEHPRFLEDGFYARHLERWLSLFGPERLKVILFEEDVRARPRHTIAEVSAHIGVQPHFDDGIGSRPVNDGSARILPLPIRQAFAPLKRRVAPIRGTPVFERARSLLAREVRYPPLSMSLRARMTELYARDIERLGTMIGRDLGCWLREAR